MLSPILEVGGSLSCFQDEAYSVYTTQDSYLGIETAKYYPGFQ